MWCGSASVLLLTHYLALFLVAAQAAILLAALGARLFQFWPASGPMFAAMAFMAAHSSRVREFADPNVAWYPLLTIKQLPMIVDWMWGPLWAAAVLLCVLLIYNRFSQKAPSSPVEPVSSDATWLAVFAGAVGWIAFLVLCFLRPNFAARYQIIFAPALLLGLALLAERACEIRSYTSIALVLVAIAPGLGYLNSDRHSLNAFEFESGSQFLMGLGAHEVTFLWDNPLNQVMAPEQMDLVGGFFFKRSASNAIVRSIRLPVGTDPNLALAAETKKPYSGFIWVYDLAVRSTAAIKYPPHFDPALYRCHATAMRSPVVLACIRTSGA